MIKLINIYQFQICCYLFALLMVTLCQLIRYKSVMIYDCDFLVGKFWFNRLINQILILNSIYYIFSTLYLRFSYSFIFISNWSDTKKTISALRNVRYALTNIIANIVHVYGKYNTTLNGRQIIKFWHTITSNLLLWLIGWILKNELKIIKHIVIQKKTS